VTNVVNLVVTMAAMIKTTMTRTITMKICELEPMSVLNFPPEATPLQIHIIESSNGPVEIPHGSLECEFLSMDLDTSHVKLVPCRITVLVTVKDGKRHLGGILVREEPSDVT
jgi:hypothetical protein